MWLRLKFKWYNSMMTVFHVISDIALSLLTCLDVGKCLECEILLPILYDRWSIYTFKCDWEDGRN